MRTSKRYDLTVFFIVILIVLLVMGPTLFLGSNEENNDPPSEVSNSYGGQTYRQCESGWGPKHCYAYIFDDAGDEVCVIGIPNTRAAQREVDLAAITCGEG